MRRASGDQWLRPWRLTPERLAAYLGGVRGIARGGAAVESDDPGAVLDGDRQPALRPWELGDAPPGPGGPDLARALATALAARPAVAAAIRPHVPLEEFAAAHLKLTVCVRAQLLLAGDGADALTPARLEAWAAAQRPRPGAEADFAASLVTAAAGRAAVDAAYAG